MGQVHAQPLSRTVAQRPGLFDGEIPARGAEWVWYPGDLARLRKVTMRPISAAHPYAVVDVFSDRPLAGNPLAVVLDADDLSDDQMAAIAVEFNLSETTFVQSPRWEQADRRLRSFTPGGDEVTGAGHNALGAWWWLAARGVVTGPVVAQELGDRVLPVVIDDADGRLTVALDQGVVELGSVADAGEGLAAALGLGAGTPIRSVVTGSVGSRHLLVEVSSEGAVDSARPDQTALARALASAGAQGCYLYATASEGSGPHDAYCRFFNPTVGILEDPATGSAAGPLAAHLGRAGAAGEVVRILQGRAMGRPSVLEIEIDGDRTVLRGTCAVSAIGELQASEVPGEG